MGGAVGGRAGAVFCALAGAQGRELETRQDSGLRVALHTREQTAVDDGDTVRPPDDSQLALAF